MDLSYLLFLQNDPAPRPPPPEDPGPEGGEREHVGEEDDDEAVTVRNPPPERRRPVSPEPATPDANPIDPRIFHGE